MKKLCFVVTLKVTNTTELSIIESVKTALKNYSDCIIYLVDNSNISPFYIKHPRLKIIKSTDSNFTSLINEMDYIFCAFYQDVEFSLKCFIVLSRRL
jgi:hypothetical protein